MANLVRSPKSGNDWTLNDLDSYHISLNQVDALTFFGLQELPQPPVDPELLANADANAMHHDRHAQLITYMDLARVAEEGEPAVVDFTVELFRTLEYVRREQVARTRMDIPLLVCGESRYAEIDVCIVDRSQSDILLLVQTDKRLENMDPANARARLVADAVAAFNETNAQREARGLHPAGERVFPGTVMLETSPVLFQIPVTQNLSTHIHHGTYPAQETCVTYCYPPVPPPDRGHSEGMKPLDNRREILKCYAAFKAIVGI